ncbi:MAG: lipocalin family protein, partial [Anaerolineales bacterium]
PTEDISLQISPLLQDQELQVSFTYWEGAVYVAGTSAGQTIDGVGYVELTGYDTSIGGVF